MALGRPSSYTDEIADYVCARLAGGESLRVICKAETIPAESVIRGWVVDDISGFASKYARARNIGLDSQAEGIEEIADDLTEDPNSRRVRIDARKWLLSKMRPDKYGDRTALEHTGPGGAPLTVTVEFVKPKAEGE